MVARRNGDYARAAQLFRSLAQGNPASELGRESQFRLGEVNYLDEAYAGAVKELAAFLNANPKDAHAPQARFFLAHSYAGQKDYPNAIAQLTLYRATSSALAGDTDAQIGDWLAITDKRAALTQYDQALKDTLLTSSARVDIEMKAAALNLQLGEPGLAAQRYARAYEATTVDSVRADLQYRWGLALSTAGEGDLAAAHWRSAVNTFPRERGAFNSLVEMVNRNLAVDDFQRGLVNYYAANYAPAIASFTRALNAAHGAAAHYYLASSYQRTGDYASALAQLDAATNDHPADALAADAWYLKGRVQGQLGRIDRAVAAYQKFAELYPGDGRADDAFWQAAWLLDGNNRQAEAAALFADIAARFPKGDRAGDGLFYAGFEQYQLKDYANAAARWRSVVSNYPHTSAAENALYWLGKLTAQQGNLGSAAEYWTAAAEPPRSFWGWRATDQLKANRTTLDASFVLDDSPAARAAAEKWILSWSPALAGTSNLAALSPAVESSPAFRRGVELASLDRLVEARREFETLNQQYQNSPRELYALALYYYHLDLYTPALQNARRLFALSPTEAVDHLPRLIQQLLYPPAYSDLVTAEAKRYGLDPALLFGLIRQESGFNNSATSSASARGLAQVMPATGQGIANQLGVRDYTVGDLYRPVVSVHFGAYYLWQTMKQFNGNTFYALMGYNGGPGNAAKWTRDDVDLAVEMVNLTETFTYVRAVYSQYREYQLIYGK